MQLDEVGGDHQLAAPHQSAGISNVPPTKRRRIEEVPGIMPKKRGAEAAAQKRGFAAAAVKRVTNQYQDKLTAKVCCPCMELPRVPRPTGLELSLWHAAESPAPKLYQCNGFGNRQIHSGSYATSLGVRSLARTWHHASPQNHKGE